MISRIHRVRRSQLDSGPHRKERKPDLLEPRTATPTGARTQIYCTLKKTGKYKKIATISKSSYMNKTLYAKKVYYKICFTKKEKGKTVFSKYSAIKKRVNPPAPITTWWIRQQGAAPRAKTKVMNFKLMRGGCGRPFCSRATITKLFILACLKAAST